MKDYEIVLACHGEPMEWMSFLPKKSKRKYQLTVSNSKGLTHFPMADRVLAIPNGGREAGHYLNFIVENYDNLHPVTVFLQADPWPHACSHISQLLAILFAEPSFPDPLSYLGSRYSLFGLEPMKGGPLDIILMDCCGRKGYSKGIPFSIGAQFYVTREIILNRPKKFYEKLLGYAKESHHSFAHLVEGHWGNVFKHVP